MERLEPSARRASEEGVAVFSLSDSELDVIINLAQPLDSAMRDPFLRAVALGSVPHWRAWWD